MIVYISSSIANGALNERIERLLQAAGFEVILPQRFCPQDIPRFQYPRRIVELCVEGMDRCDFGLFLLDAYGHDSSFECGYFAKSGKPLIGYVGSNLRFRNDWCIKGSLSGIVTTDPLIHRELVSDPFFRQTPIRQAERVELLGTAVRELVRELLR